MFLPSPWLEIRFQIGHFADFDYFKADIDFANFGQVKTVPICFFTDCGQVSYFTQLGWGMPQKTIQTLSIW